MYYMKYYSEYLKRVFDTPEECEREELAFLTAEQAKKQEHETMLEALEVAKANYDVAQANVLEANKASREAYNELVKLVRTYAAKYGSVPKEFNNLQFLTEMSFMKF